MKAAKLTGPSGGKSLKSGWNVTNQQNKINLLCRQ